MEVVDTDNHRKVMGSHLKDMVRLLLKGMEDMDLLLVNMARLLDLRDSTVHHPQVLLPGNTSLQLHISKRLRDLRHHPASATFPAKSQT